MALDPHFKELIAHAQWDEAIAYCEAKLAEEPSNCAWRIYQGICHEEKGEKKIAESCYLKAYHINTNLMDHAAHLRDTHFFLYSLKKNPDRFLKLKFVSCLYPADKVVLDIIVNEDPSYRQFKTPDIVLFTGTLPWKSFSPDSLDKEGLGGSETAFVMMAKKLHERGFKVACFCNTQGRKNYEGVDYFPILDFYAFQQVHSYPLLISSRFLYPIMNSHLKNNNILWLHDMESPLQENLRPYLDQLKKIFVLSDYQKEYIKVKFDIPEEKFFKTKNGFEPKLFDQRIKTKPVRRLLYMSRPERGLIEAIRIFKALKQKYSDLELHVCTYTTAKSLEDDDQLKPVSEQLKQPGIVFHGSLQKQELYRLAKSCGILLYPNTTFSETSCIAAIEAMACGLPIVTSSRGALPETIIDKGGITVPYTTNHDDLVVNLAKAVDHLFMHQELWQQFSEQGYERAWSNYTWDQVADEWVDLIKNEGWARSNDAAQ